MSAGGGEYFVDDRGEEVLINLFAEDDEPVCGHRWQDEGKDVEIASRIDLASLSSPFQEKTHHRGGGLHDPALNDASEVGVARQCGQ